MTLVAQAAGAGPWIRLPEAVARLAERPADAGARQVVEAAEASVLAEARAGHLAALDELLGAYVELVSPLATGEARVNDLRQRVGHALVAYGDEVRALDSNAAGTAWALAARVASDADATRRLANLLLPPADPAPGAVWTSPVDGAELVFMPPFRFLMGCTQGDTSCAGDERYLRWVETGGFWMDRTEVSNRRYRRCVEAGRCTPPADRVAFDDPDLASEPVVDVTWTQARVYARWSGRRLPSEAEWERAARGKRTDGRFPWGNYRMRERANLEGTAGRDVFAALAPEASFPWTGWGLYDLAGNAWEWCQDTYHANLISGPRDGSAWVTGGEGRVLRGGSWRTPVDEARVSARWSQDPLVTADDIGFRCVADPGEDLAPGEVAALGAEVYPVRSDTANVLTAADLDSADRRYLERRAVTWLVLEGRVWDALPRAVTLLSRDPSDPVARDLLDRVEDELTAGAVRGDVQVVREALERYRRAVGNDDGLVKRLAELDRTVAAALKSAGRERRGRGDERGAAECFRLALKLEPDDAELRRLLRSLVPEAGARRAWEGDGREMVWVPSGTYLMGRSRGDNLAGLREQPAHTVRLAGFWIDRTEVTNAAYARCVAAGACTPPHRTGRYQDPDFASDPVLWVDWEQARAYAAWAGKRLPSEAEWEYAARAGAASRYPWGEEWQDGRANGFGVKGIDRWIGAAPVGVFPPNRWGILDMIGNASEWVEDVYHSRYDGAPTDGRPWGRSPGDPPDADRVLRGGSFLDFPPGLRVSARDHRAPNDWGRTTGFRCAADQ